MADRSDAPLHREVTTPRPPPAPDILKGTRYRALRRIATGSTCEVWEADGPGGGPFAIKVLHARNGAGGELGGLGCAEIDWRFAQEARVLMTTRHPNVVPVHAMGTTAAGAPFLVMPALRGETLRQRLDRSGRLPAARACELLAGALDGLDHVHHRGVVHRDLKPANVFLVTDGDSERAVVLDFGVAQVGGDTFDPCSEAHVIGTPRYLAPEQVLGEPVDARSDVYALGIVLFEAIAGRGPYRALGPFEVMRAHVAARPDRLGSHAPCGAALEAVIERALCKAPRDRWPSARAFAEALRRSAADGPGLARSRVPGRVRLRRVGADG